MASVTVHTGLTLQVGPMSGNNYARVDVTLADIDPDLPLDEQIKGGIGAAAKAFNAVLVELDRQVEVISGKKR